jgi:predicted nuclease of predicted toxin-antitoxin system
MGRKLVTALADAGGRAVTHDSLFPAEDTLDEEWLRRAGSEGWVVLTKDKLIRKRPLERAALIAARVRAFVFTGGNVSGVEMAESIIAAMPRILRIIATTPPPFIARITASGAVHVIEASVKEIV